MLVTLSCVAAGGVAIHWAGDSGAPEAAGSAISESTPAAQVRGTLPAASNGGARERETHERFQQAVTMLRAGRHEHALAALHRVLQLAPRLPEAHVNMGFALLGLGRPAAARDFFESATALRPEQSNAYYGLAVALEAMHDLAGARGAMRTYIHLVRADDPRLPRARAALWEWEAQLRSAPPAVSPVQPHARR